MIVIELFSEFMNFSMVKNCIVYLRILLIVLEYYGGFYSYLGLLINRGFGCFIK